MGCIFDIDGDGPIGLDEVQSALGIVLICLLSIGEPHRVETYLGSFLLADTLDGELGQAASERRILASRNAQDKALSLRGDQVLGQE